MAIGGEMPTFKVKGQKNGVVMVDLLDVTAVTPRWVMLTSDEHLDSPLCDKARLRAHLNKALERDAMIIEGGDAFDAMQGRYDKRRSREEIEARFMNTDAYFDALVETAFNFWSPYRHNLLGFTLGNHEQSVITHYGTNLMQRLVRRLNEIPGENEVLYLDFSGYIVIQTITSGKGKGSIQIRYTHGSGSGGPVTGNKIKASRRSKWLATADIVWSAHVHRQDIDAIVREHCSQKGVITEKIQWHVVTPGYKRRGRWETQSEFEPSSRGSAWVYVTNNPSGGNNTFDVTLELTG